MGSNNRVHITSAESGESINIEVGVLVALLLCNQATSHGRIVEHRTVSNYYVHASNRTTDQLPRDRTRGEHCYYFYRHHA